MIRLRPVGVLGGDSEFTGQLVSQGAFGLPQPFNLVGNIVPCRTAGPDKLRVKSAYKRDDVVTHGVHLPQRQ
jgi:hypothetical protein